MESVPSQTETHEQGRPSLVGRDVGPYRIVEQLGEGGMGVVYKAMDRALERPVALKVLFDLDDPENINRFRREAKALAKLAHPNTVHIFWVGEVDNFPCFAMEYSEGITVYDLLKKDGHLPIEIALDIAIQSARGLEAARQAGVVHRDIKPNNLIVTDDGTVKIADFGLAKLVTEASNHLTQSGIVMGTPYYMSPEQGQGEPIDHRADLYSLGATLYHMLSGYTPYEAENPVSLIVKHVREPIPDITEANPLIPRELKIIVDKTLAKAADDRYQDYDSLIEDLERFQAGQAPIHARTRWLPAQVPTWAAVLGGVALGTVLVLALGRLPRWWTSRALSSGTQSLQDTGATGEADRGDALGLPEETDMERLIQALNAQDADSRARAATGLGAAKHSPGADALATHLTSESEPHVRAAIAWALGRTGGDHAAPALTQALNDADPAVVAAAAKALGTLSVSSSASALREALARAKDADVKRAITNTLSTLLVAGQPEEMGGHTRTWWEESFSARRVELQRARGLVTALNQSVRYYEEKYDFRANTKAADLEGEPKEIFQTVYALARNELTKARQDVKRAESALAEIEKQANKSSIPTAWRP